MARPPLLRRRAGRELWFNSYLGGVSGFLVGIVGNLVAAWVQQDLLNDVFAPEYLTFLLITAVVGIAIGLLTKRPILLVAIGTASTLILLTSAIYVPRTCRYGGATPVASIELVIQAEAEAAKSKDISIIQAIFAKEAIVRDGSSGQLWNDPIARYETLFNNTTFTNAEHLEIQPAGPGNKSTIAWFTSASRGSYVSNIDSQPHSYDNPPLADHWTLSKNSMGCWVITNFTFNAKDIPFP
jgi:uncharacterized membrane protein YeaQ/YmgE (transglycosylase-associated protein family)